MYGTVQNWEAAVDWLLDQLLPRYEFRTRYTRRIAAPPAQVWAALDTLTYRELPVTRLLMAARSGGQAQLDGPVVQALGLPVLGRRTGREAIVGAVAKFWRPHPVRGPRTTTTPEGFAAFAEPGWAKAALSFQLSPLPGGQTLLAAETRIHATDTAARRAFAAYWLMIRAGGAGLIRLEMLRAIARRAERTQPVTGAAAALPQPSTARIRTARSRQQKGLVT